MRKLIMILALCIGVQGVSMAQDANTNRRGQRNMTPEQRAEKQTERMQQALQLTEAQKKAVYELNLATATEMKASRAENKEQFKAVHKKKEEKLKSILSADQFAKYQEMKAERMKKMQHKKGAHRELRQG